MGKKKQAIVVRRIAKIFSPEQLAHAIMRRLVDDGWLAIDCPEEWESGLHKAIREELEKRG
jgi:trans-aconitate methyltransferase